jgi:transposase
MKVVAHHSEQELERLASREKGADLAKRLRTVLLAKQGFTAPEVATCTGFSRRTVQDWVARYNQEGLRGLETRPGRGRKGPLTAEEAERLQRRIEAGPLPEDGVCVLRGLDVQRILQQEFGKLRSLDSVYRLLHRLGFSSLVPRPRHPKADPAAQEEFKKKCASNSFKLAPGILGGESKSSSKTRLALANRER